VRRADFGAAVKLVDRGRTSPSTMAVTNTSFPEYVSKFRRKMVEIRSRFKETSRLGLYSDYWVPPAGESASPLSPLYTASS